MVQSTSRLRALGFRDILDQATRLYFRNFFTLSTIVAIVAIPIVLVLYLSIAVLDLPGQLRLLFDFSGYDYYGYSRSTPKSVDELRLLTSVFLTGAGLAIFGYSFFVVLPMALTRVVSSSFWGNPMGVWQGYQIGWRPLGNITLAIGFVGPLFLLFSAPFWVLPLIALVSPEMAAGFAVICSCYGFPMLAIFSVCFYLFGARWGFLYHASAIEGTRGLGCLERSWRLTNTQTFRSIWMTFLLSIFALFVSIAPFGVITVLLMFVPSMPATVNSIIILLDIIWVLCICWPVFACGLTAYYYDLRVRREGLDMELSMREIEASLTEQKRPNVTPV